MLLMRLGIRIPVLNVASLAPTVLLTPHLMAIVITQRDLGTGQQIIAATRLQDFTPTEKSAL